MIFAAACGGSPSSMLLQQLRQVYCNFLLSTSTFYGDVIKPEAQGSVNIHFCLLRWNKGYTPWLQSMAAIFLRPKLDSIQGSALTVPFEASGPISLYGCLRVFAPWLGSTLKNQILPHQNTRSVYKFICEILMCYSGKLNIFFAWKQRYFWVNRESGFPGYLLIEANWRLLSLNFYAKSFPSLLEGIPRISTNIHVCLPWKSL